MVVKVVVLDMFEKSLYALIEREAPAGWECVQAATYAAADQIVAAKEADVILAGWAPVTTDIMCASGRLRIVQKLGVGIERVDLDYCRERNIAVARLAGANSVPVAEHVVLFMLAALRRLPLSNRRIRAGEWFKEEARGFQRELRGKIVGLIGLGYVGGAVAQRLGGFEVEIVYYDPRRLAPEAEKELGLRYVTLDELTITSDIVSLHVPLTAETRHLIDERRLRAMKPGAIVINCARGGLIDEEALSRALRDGHIAEAALDTFADEPLTNLELVSQDSVIATPHTAGATVDNFAFVAKRAMENVRRYLASEPLPSDDVVLPGLSGR